MRIFNKVLLMVIILCIGHSINYNYNFDSFTIGYLTCCGLIFCLELYDIFFTKNKKMEDI